MHKLALIGLGGLLGTLARYWISEWVETRSQSVFPYGTLAVNVVGCFVAGFLFQSLGQATVSPEMRLALFTGFLGGFTTFSAYGLQTIVLARTGMLSMAAANIILSNVAGLAMVWVGAGLSRVLIPSSDI
jgi:CrcB protein